MAQKYFVFKHDDFKNWLTGDGEFPDSIEDAVVIRLQDVFAPPALEAYANAIVVAVEVLNGADHCGVKERLTVVADYFHEMAEKSYHMERKLPD